MNLIYICFALLISSVQAAFPTEFIIPKDVQLLTPIQKQYEYLLLAFRQNIGEKQASSPETLDEDAPKKKKLLTTMSLSPQTQTEMALELMTRLDTPEYDIAHRTMFSPDTWQSLRLIDQEPSALSGIAPDMKTIFGKLFLARLLTTPTNDVERIRARQKAIKELCKNPTVTAEIANICGTIQQAQEQLISLTSKDHPLYDSGMRIYQHEFFVRSFGPRSNKSWNRFAKLFGDLWYCLGIVTLPAANLGGIMGYAKKSAAELKKTFGIDHRFVAALLAALTAYNGAIQVPGIITWIRERFKAMNYFYNALLPLKIFFNGTQALKSRLEKHQSLKYLSDEIDTALTLDHPKLKKLRDILMGRAFRSRKAAHFFGGDLILAIDLLRDCKSDILKGVGLIGAMDAYSSLASWYTKSKNNAHRPLCFAQFITNAERPSLNIENFWHVLAPENPHLNSIKLGGGHPQSAVITGIFESGKSTVLQSIALNVVCAQSLGVCLAHSYCATPYASINIYANIKDDLANNRSLFKTELYRALQLLQQIKRMKPGHFSFTVADATFTGTEAGAGQAAAYAVARYLGELPNSIALHATNFLSLSILGINDPTHFANYILPTRFDGKTIQTYKLTPGTQNPQLSTAIFKEENLPTAMITEMEAQLANIEHK